MSLSAFKAREGLKQFLYQQAPARRLRHRLQPQETLRRLLRRRRDRGGAKDFRRFPVPGLWRSSPGIRPESGFSGRFVPPFGAVFRLGVQGRGVSNNFEIVNKYIYGPKFLVKYLINIATLLNNHL